MRGEFSFLAGLLMLSTAGFSDAASEATGVDFDQNTGISSTVESVKKDATDKLRQKDGTTSAQGVMRPDGKCQVSISGAEYLDRTIRYAEGSYRINEACQPILVNERRLSELPSPPTTEQKPFEVQSGFAQANLPIPLTLSSQKEISQCEGHVLVKEDNEARLVEVINATKWEWD